MSASARASPDVFLLDRPHGSDRRPSQREGGVERGEATHRQVQVQQLLQNLGRSRQRSRRHETLLEERAGLVAQRVRCANRVYQDVDVDEDHRRLRVVERRPNARPLEPVRRASPGPCRSVPSDGAPTPSRIEASSTARCSSQSGSRPTSRASHCAKKASQLVHRSHPRRFTLFGRSTQGGLSQPRAQRESTLLGQAAKSVSFFRVEQDLDPFHV